MRLLRARRFPFLLAGVRSGQEKTGDDLEAGIAFTDLDRQLVLFLVALWSSEAGYGQGQ